MVVNNLVDQLSGQAGASLTAEEKEARKNLVDTLITGITAASGGDAAIANTAAQIETENNAVWIPVILGAAWLIDKGITAYDAYQDIQALRSGEKTLEQLATEKGEEYIIQVIAGNIGKYGIRAVKKGGKWIAGHTDDIVRIEKNERLATKSTASGDAKATGTALGNAERGVLTEANFAQNRIKSDRSFSPDGQKIYSDLAGKPIRTVDDLADALKTGVIKPNQLPVDYVDMNGTRLILNTRTSTALEQAGVPRSQWFGRNQTGVEAYPGKTFNDLAADQLRNNKLPPTGADELKSVRP